MNALFVSLVCLLPVAAEPPTEPADEAKKVERLGHKRPSRLRVWSDSTGKQQIEAEFVKLSRGLVFLKTSDGKIATAPVDRLCSLDREWLWKNTTSDGRFRWEDSYVLPRVDDAGRHRIPDIILRTECRPLATTLSTDDPIRIALRWSRSWYLPASRSEPAIHRRIPGSDVPIEQLDTLKSLKFSLLTPSGRRYCVQADIQDNNPDVPSHHRPCTTLFLTITDEALSEAHYVRGKWTSGKIAGFDEVGWFTIYIAGTLVPYRREDASFPFTTSRVRIKRVTDNRKTMAEIDAIARAKVAELCGVAYPRGLPGRGVPTAVTELKNGNRQAIYAVRSYRLFGEGWNTVELTPQGNPIRVTVWNSHAAGGEETFRRLFHRYSDAKTIWPQPTDNR